MPRIAKAYLVIGFLLLIFGILFDFLFVQWKVGMKLLETNPVGLNSWAKQLYDATKFYIVIIGVVSLILAILTSKINTIRGIDWLVFTLIMAGSILLIGAGLRYAVAGPSYKWEIRCTVLTAGLIGIVGGFLLEIYRFLKVSGKEEVNLS